MDRAAIIESLQSSIEEATRYPREVLTAEATLEDELGIDSVKMVEIFARIKRTFGIPQDIKFDRQQVKTIGGIADAIVRFQSGGSLGAAPVSTPALVAAPVVAVAPPPAPVVVAPVASAPAPVASAPQAAPSAPQVFAPKPAMPSPPSAQVFHMFGNDRRVSRDRRAASTAPGELLAGRVVLVTGSGRGLGRELALGFAAQGATVIVNSFHSRDAGDATCADIVQAGGKAIHLWGSIANEAHVTRIFDEIGKRYGRLDALIANASDGYIGPFENMTSEHLEKGFKTNVVGLHACATAAAKLMAGGGQIVSLSTITSNRYLKDFTCQGVLKAAVETMTKYLAVELGGRGIRVNCVSAGPVYGDLITRFPNAQERIGRWESITPTGTLTRPDELARFIAFLISGTVPSANGATFTFDGGLSLGIDADVTDREGAASGIENLG